MTTAQTRSVLRQRVLHNLLQIGAVGRNRRELVAMMLDLAHVEQQRSQRAIELTGDSHGHLVGRLGARSIQADEFELFDRSSASLAPSRRPRISGRIVM
ncbi:hypothetical protein ACVW16_003405 [Bradyrhizobium sp. USDA 4474]